MENAKPKKKKTGLIIVLGLLVLIALAAVGYMFNYTSAKKAAISGDFETAKSTLMLPQLTEKHDPLLLDYIDAGLLLDQEDYVGAAAAFKKLADEGYLDSQQKLDQIKETIYPLAISMYQNGDTTPVADAYYDKSGETTIYPQRNYLYYRYLEILQGYKDADRYLVLSRATTGDLTDKEFDQLMADLDFEDTKEVLMQDIKTAERFLLGVWNTRDGKYYFEMKDDGDTLYTLPYPYNDDDKYFYSIVDGLYFNYLREDDVNSLTQEDMEDGAFFEFKVIDENTIEVYCYVGGETYTMYRAEPYEPKT